MGSGDSRAPKVRPAAVAGRWYPGERSELHRLVDELLARAATSEARQRAGESHHRALRALVVPHAAIQYSGDTAAHGWQQARSSHVERVVVLAPNHRVALRGGAVDPSASYETPLGRIEVDADAVATLVATRELTADPGPFAAEHAIEMQLPFMQVLFPDAKLVPILIGEMRRDGAAAISRAIAPLVDASTLVVVSSDFTHYGSSYGYVPFTERVPERLEALDRETLDALATLDRDRFQAHLERTGTTVCGRRPLATFLELAPRTWEADVVAYTTSGAITGDFEQSVSYAALAYTAESRDSERSRSAIDRPGLTVRERQALLFAARQSLEALFHPPRLTERLGAIARTAGMTRWAGVFVSLHRRRGARLRGCIGTFEAQVPLLEAVCEEARNAATRDPRFPPVRADELDGLEIEISVLGPLVPVADVEEIVVGRDGLVISQGERRGVLLPQVASRQGWSRERFLDNVCLKAELPADAWRTGAHIERFPAEVFGED